MAGDLGFSETWTLKLPPKPRTQASGEKAPVLALTNISSAVGRLRVITTFCGPGLDWVTVQLIEKPTGGITEFPADTAVEVVNAPRNETIVIKAEVLRLRVILI